MRWVDPEWEPTLQRSVIRLWEMYEESNNLRIDEKINHAKFLKELQEEKRKIDKKYNVLVGDMNHWMEATEKKVQDENLQKLKREAMEGHLVLKMRTALSEMQKERNSLNDELSKLKEGCEMQQKDWELEKRELKEEKKKLEYAMYDLFKASGANREKLKRIKLIIDE